MEILPSPSRAGPLIPITQSWQPRQTQIRESQNHRMGWVGRDHQQERTCKAIECKHHPSTALPTTPPWYFCALRRLLLLLLVPGHRGSTGWCLPRVRSELLHKEHSPKAFPEKTPQPTPSSPCCPCLGGQRAAAVCSHGLKLFQNEIIRFMKNSKQRWHCVLSACPAQG